MVKRLEKQVEDDSDVIQELEKETEEFFRTVFLLGEIKEQNQRMLRIAGILGPPALLSVYLDKNGPQIYESIKSYIEYLF